MNFLDETLIEKILTSNDQHSQIKVIKWYVDNDVVPAGTNYLSEISRLTICYKKDGTEKKKVLLIKVPTSSPMYGIYENGGAYEKEMLMYTEVLPQIYTMDEEYFTARHYFIGDKMSILLKDLSQSGYKNINRLNQLDLEHSCYALKCLAKFHAVSIKVEKNNGLSDKVKNEKFFHPDNEDARKYFMNIIRMFIDNLPTDIKQKYPQQLVALQSVTFESIIEDILPKSGSFNVLNHGDFWTNNIMFKYDKYGILKKVKLVDFQLCRWASPALDLIYFFITTVKFDIYEKYSDLLLDTYLSTLNKVLVTLDCATYTLEELASDIESRFSFACLIISRLPLFIIDPNDRVSMEEIREDGEPEFCWIEKAYQGERFVKFVVKWFIHFTEKGILGNKNKGNRFSTDELADTLNGIEQ